MSPKSADKPKAMQNLGVKSRSVAVARVRCTTSLRTSEATYAISVHVSVGQGVR